MASGSEIFVGMCCVSVASNIDPERNIVAALALLSEKMSILKVSTFFQTAPIGRPEQDAYLNGAVAVECGVAPRALKYEVLRPIEAMLGRQRTADAYAARTIDLDMALCGTRTVNEPGLVIPDPDIAHRPFLAAALLELCPDTRLPDTGAALKELVSDEERRLLRPNKTFSKMLQERFQP